MSLRKIKTGLKRNRFAFALLQPIYRAYRKRIMVQAQRELGVQPNKVTFSSFSCTRYADNPRYVSEKLHELCPEADIVWLFSQQTLAKAKVPDYVRKVAAISREGLVEQATARFWVDNYQRNETLYLNTDSQYYIQTWHGDRGFKRVGADNDHFRHEVYGTEKHCALMVAGSDFGRRVYRSAFRYEGPVLMDGCPRNDLLVNGDPALAARVRAALGVPEGTGLLLYAPTFRSEQIHGRQTGVLDIPRVLDHLEAKDGRPWRCLYRAHYWSTGLDVARDARVQDATGYPEMAELLLVSDMLITDYSSCGGDFTLQRRPMFLYQPDVEAYLKDDRSFYFDMAESPFLIAHSSEELERLIDETDAQRARENCEAIDRFFGTSETGHAAESVCRFIMERMQKEGN